MINIQDSTWQIF